MKKFFNILIFILLIALYMLTFAGCKVHKDNKPWDAYNVEWYSFFPNIKITVIENEKPRGYIVVNDEKIDVALLWGETYGFAIIYADCEVISEEDVLLSGAVTDFNIESTILKVEKDNVFNYQYKTITLYRRAIEE